MASALLTIGLISLAHKFDPVLQRAQPASTFQVVANEVPYPGPTRRGGLTRPAAVLAANEVPYPGPTRRGPALTVAS